MIIDTRYVDNEDGRFQVTVHTEDPIADPRDWWDGCSDDDVIRWRQDDWTFVYVRVIKMCRCGDCSLWHESDRMASLGMVAFGAGAEWSVTLDQLVSEHPVPDLITEIMGA